MGIMELIVMRIAMNSSRLICRGPFKRSVNSCNINPRFLQRFQFLLNIMPFSTTTKHTHPLLIVNNYVPNI